jgi:hypothetical protein
MKQIELIFHMKIYYIYTKMYYRNGLLVVAQVEGAVDHKHCESVSITARRISILFKLEQAQRTRPIIFRKKLFQIGFLLVGTFSKSIGLFRLNCASWKHPTELKKKLKLKFQKHFLKLSSSKLVQGSRVQDESCKGARRDGESSGSS